MLFGSTCEGAACLLSGISGEISLIFLLLPLNEAFASGSIELSSARVRASR